MNTYEGEQHTSGAVLGAFTILQKDLPEIYSSLVAGPYRKPHPDSEVNSLWSMEQCDQGKSTK